MKITLRLALLCSAVFLAVAAAAQDQKFASLGDFKLQNGEIIKDCRIGYRTYGTLASDKSNIVVIPTWASGTTEQLAGNVGPGKLADSTKYYVILVDALANGVSSSPSNSVAQPHMKFPKITIRDMVESQHELLTKFLGITHVKAVMGVSMGGMQTFQWLTAYPDFMDKGVPIVGSPRLASYDMLLWTAQIDAITHNPAWQGGEYKDEPAALADYEFSSLLLTTPEHFNNTTTRQQLFEGLEKARAAKSWGYDANNKIRQAQAMMSLDVAAPFAGNMEESAKTVKAKLLVIVGKQDHVVTPGPAIEFAKLTGAKLLVLESDCGHLSNACESEKVVKAVGGFLESKPIR
jgi:homoserine O-acetyltransferase/O-succinyltransferase